MSEEDRAKTAIMTAFGKYEFSRMAFGLVMLPVHSETYAQGLGGMHGFWSSYATSTFRDLCTGSWRYAWLLV